MTYALERPAPGGWLTWPRRWSLATRVAAAVAALLVPLLALVLLSYAQLSAERRVAEIENTAEVAQAISTTVDAFARDLESTVLAAALALGQQIGPLDQSTVGPYLRALSDEYAVLRGLFITNPEGRVVASALGAGIGLDLSQRPYMEALRAGMPTVWGPGIRGIETGEITVTYGRAVRDAQGAVRGYLVAAFYPPALVDRLRLHLAPDADVTLIDDQGLLLHSTARPDLPFDQRSVTQSPRLQAARAGQVVHLDGTTRLFGGEARYGALVPVPRTGWIVVVSRPLAPLEAHLRAQLFRQAGGITAIVLLGVVVLVPFVRRVVRPITALAGVAAAIERGERPVVPEVGPDPEVAHLAAALRTMSAAVAEREDALRRAVDDRDKALAEAEAARRHLYELFMQAPAAIAVLRGADHIVEFANPRLRQLVGDRDMLGKPVRESMPELERQGVIDLLDRVYATGESHFDEEARRRWDRRGDGVLEEGYVNVVYQPYRGPDGEVTGILVHAIEVTDLVRARQTVESVAAERDTFLASASHDLKNPLTAIRGTAQVLGRQLARTGTVDPERLAAGLVTIEQTSDQMLALINEMLDVTRLRMGERLALDRQATDLVALARRAAAQQQQAIETRRIVVQSSVDELTGDWDAARLGRVLDNLLDNAVKYSPAGTDVTVTIDRDNGWAVLHVRDQGGGIPAADLPFVFEWYRRGSNVDPGSAGSGIGLAGAKRIVEQHGGTIAVESKDGACCEFIVRLPLPAAGEEAR